LTPWPTSPWGPCDEPQLRALVKAAFAQRRKTLRNNLKTIIDSTQLEALGIDPGARAETLDLPQFIEITNAIHAQNAV
jgi:16S rRNA (adenine1518-N6/adenine1519-N6)-dimethyltransferase